MYYGAGNYEAFAKPEKPEGADRKSAYIIGTGLAGLSAAFYLVRDGQVKAYSSAHKTKTPTAKCWIWTMPSHRLNRHSPSPKA